MVKVIFACTHNAVRSQMAAAFFNTYADKSKAYAISAGTAPAEHIPSEVCEVMREVSVDLTGAETQLLTSELAAGAKLLITMGCKESCPVIHGLRHVDWLNEEPKGDKMEKLRAIRDDIHRRVQKLITEEKLEAIRN